MRSPDMDSLLLSTSSCVESAVPASGRASWIAATSAGPTHRACRFGSALRSWWIGHETYKTERYPMPQRPAITLHPFRSIDETFFAGMAPEERVTRYLGDGRPWDRQMIEDRVGAALRQEPLDDVGATRWFLALEAEVPVGILVSTRKEEGVEIGYWVSPAHWGRGVAGTMLDRVLITIPGLYKTQAIVAHVDPDNTVSAKLLSRRGFLLEPTKCLLDRYSLAPGVPPR